MKKRMKFLSVVALSSMALLSYGFTTTDINHEQTVYETQENEISTQEVSNNTVISVQNTVLQSIELVDWSTESTSTYWELTFAFNYQPYINFTPDVQWDVVGVAVGSTYDWKDVNSDTETISVGNIIYLEKHDEPDRYVDYFTISGQTQDSDGLEAGAEYTFAFNITDGSILAEENVVEMTFTTPDEYLAEVQLNYVNNTQASFELTFDENILTAPEIEYSVNGGAWIDVTPIVDSDIYNQTILVEGLTPGVANDIDFRINGVVQTIAIQLDTLTNIESTSLIESVDLTNNGPYLVELELLINSSLYEKSQGIELEYRIAKEDDFWNPSPGANPDVWISARSTYDVENSTFRLNFNETYLEENTTYVVEFRINGVEQQFNGTDHYTFTTEAFTDYGFTAGIIAGSALLGTLLLFGGYYLYNRMHKSKKQKKENK